MYATALQLANFLRSMNVERFEMWPFLVTRSPDAPVRHVAIYNSELTCALHPAFFNAVSKRVWDIQNVLVDERVLIDTLRALGIYPGGLRMSPETLQRSIDKHEESLEAVNKAVAEMP